MPHAIGNPGSGRCCPTNSTMKNTTPALQTNPTSKTKLSPRRGYAWETEVFGGIVGSSASESKPEDAYVLLIQDWPTWNESNPVKAFQLKDVPPRDTALPDRSALSLDRHGYRPHRENFIVSMLYVHNLQQQCLWNSSTTYSLRIPRTLGYRCDLNGIEARSPESRRMVVMCWRGRVPRAICLLGAASA